MKWRNTCKEEARTKPWPQVEQMLIDIDNERFFLRNEALKRIGVVPEDSSWDVKTSIVQGQSRYQLEMQATWLGLVFRPEIYSFTKSCEVIDIGNRATVDCGAIKRSKAGAEKRWNCGRQSSLIDTALAARLANLTAGDDSAVSFCQEFTNSQFPIPNSQLPTVTNSQLPIRNSQMNLRRILTVAINVFWEVIRDRILYLIIIFALLMGAVGAVDTGIGGDNREKNYLRYRFGCY